MTEGPAARLWIRDVDEADFERAVVERSRSVPVLVDFWASWCAPCRMLGPVLERLVDEERGRIELAKIDTDRNQGLAQRHQIRGIPAVKLFVGGEVVAEFVGAQDAGYLRSFIADWLPSPARQALIEARKVLLGTDDADGPAVDRATAALGTILDDPKLGTEARRLLAEHHLSRGQLELAAQTLAPLDDDESAGPLRQSLAMARDLAALGGEAAARQRLLENPDDLDARWGVAAAQQLAGDLAGALTELLELVRRNRRYRDDGARLAMLALFARLGPQSDLARDFRRQLQIVT